MTQRIIKKFFVLIILSFLAGCGPSEKAISTAEAQVRGTDNAIKDATQAAEAIKREQTLSAESTEQARDFVETEQAVIVKKTEQAIVELSQTVEALSFEQTQVAIPQDCKPGGIFVDFEGDASHDIADILKIETYLDGEYLTIVMYLKTLPDEIEIDAASKGYGEYFWGVLIDVDNDPNTGAINTRRGNGIEYSLRLFHWSREKDTPLKGPFEQLLQNEAKVWKYEIDGKHSPIGTATWSSDYANKTITLKGYVPGINGNSLLYFVTALEQNEDFLCE